MRAASAALFFTQLGLNRVSFLNNDLLEATHADPVRVDAIDVDLTPAPDRRWCPPKTANLSSLSPAGFESAD